MFDFSALDSDFVLLYMHQTDMDAHESEKMEIKLISEPTSKMLNIFKIQN